MITKKTFTVFIKHDKYSKLIFYRSLCQWVTIFTHFSLLFYSNLERIENREAEDLNNKHYQSHKMSKNYKETKNQLSLLFREYLKVFSPEKIYIDIKNNSK